MLHRWTSWWSEIETNVPSPQVNSLSCSEKKKTKLELNSIFEYEFQGYEKKKERKKT